MSIITNFKVRIRRSLLSFIAVTSLITSAGAQNIYTFAGNGINGFSGDGGPAVAAALNEPVAGCFDPSGNFYFSEYGNHRVRKVSTAGIITTFAGNGIAGFLGDGGLAVSAELNKPFGICADDFGNIYIADSYNDRIRKVTSAGIISTFAGIGMPGFTGDGGLATSAKLYEPTGMCKDASGNFYIADNNNNRIRKIDASGIISTVAGSNMGGFSGDGGQATSAQLHFPYQVWADANQNLFIADYLNNRIRKVNSAGTIFTVAGNGNGAYSGDGGAATSAEINYPQDVTTDAAGNIFIADFLNNVVRKVDVAGIIHTIAGTNTGGYAGDGGPATAAELYFPTGVRLDAFGNIYIADSFNDRVRKILTTSAGINEAAANQAPAAFPVPADRLINVECKNARKVELYDYCGRLVFQQEIFNSKTLIDTRCFANGFYELKIISDNGVTQFSKVEIMHR